VSQPRISFGVQGRDVKQEPGEKLEASCILRDVEEGRVRMTEGKQEGEMANRPQDSAGMYANDFPSNPRQFAKKGSLLSEFCSVVVIYPLLLLMVYLPLQLLWAAPTPTYHSLRHHNNEVFVFFFLCLITKYSRFNLKDTLDQGFTRQQLPLAGRMGLIHS